jgi:hypothetical protein
MCSQTTSLHHQSVTVVLSICTGRVAVVICLPTRFSIGNLSWSLDAHATLASPHVTSRRDWSLQALATSMDTKAVADDLET